MKASKSIILIFFTLYISTLFITQALHPLDSLTPFELDRVQALVKKSYKKARFQYVGLDEPEKPKLRSWLSQNQPNKHLGPRRAFVIARVDSTSHEIIIDLLANSILSDKIYHGSGYPMLSNEEQGIASELPFKYAPFKASIKKRGLNLSEVVCTDFSIGWYGEKNTKRVATILCFYSDDTPNMYMRPIEGVVVTVDFDEMKIVDYRDRWVAPVPKSDGTDYRESKQDRPFDNHIKPITILQPDGPSFTLDGNRVR
ncbi:hypothetical protein ACS0TY_014340 [Phlomoides rotata]